MNVRVLSVESSFREEKRRPRTASFKFGSNSKSGGLMSRP